MINNFIGKVLTHEQMDELEKLGVDCSNASMSYHFTDDENEGATGFEYILHMGYSPEWDDTYPAYILSDILERLPIRIEGDHEEYYMVVTPYLSHIELFHEWYDGNKNRTEMLHQEPFTLIGCYNMLRFWLNLKKNIICG